MARNTNIQPKNNILEKEEIVEIWMNKNAGIADNNYNQLTDIQVSTFQQAFENAMTVDESRKRTLQHIDELWEKSSRQRISKVF